MDLTKIDLSQYYLVEASEIEIIDSNKTETFYDIEVEDDHSFFIVLNNNELMLSHNCDGAHISGLFIGFFQKYVSSLLKDNKIKKFRTPIITFDNTKNDTVKFFFTLQEYNDYLQKNGVPKSCTTRYYKGLGSWSKDRLKKLIDKYGLEFFIEDIEIDETSDRLIDEWIGDTSENCESRKEYLREFEVNIELA